MAAKYPSIPDPTTDPAGLRDSVLALKQAFEILAGLRGTGGHSAVTSDRLASAGYLTSVPDLSGTATPLVEGVAAVGTSTKWAHEDHIHPASTISVATQADQETATSTTLPVTPGRQQFHPSAIKAWVHVSQSGGTYTKAASYNVSSISKVGSGVITVNFTTPFSATAAFSCVVGLSEVVNGVQVSENAAARAVSSISVDIRNSTTPFAHNDVGFTVVCFGDQ